VLAVTVGVPHASVAVAVPNARSIADAEGLHPSVKLFPEVEIVGAVTSAVQVAVRDAVEVLPQASIAVNVLVCDLLHNPVAAAVLAVTVVEPHASVAVAVPNARSIADAEGLHPSVKLFPDVEIVGGVGSSAQVAVRDAVDVLPQASIAVNVLVVIYYMNQIQHWCLP
jgi:flavin-binding protein dodecin